jgi:hypothetical protein
MGNHPTYRAALTRSGAATQNRATDEDRAVARRLGGGDRAQSNPAVAPDPSSRTGKTFLFAFYLGAVTLVIGSGGITVHSHTRGTLDPDRALFGLGWSRSATAG